MLVRVPLFDANVMASVNGAWIDLQKRAGAVNGFTVLVANRSAGTFDVDIETSADKTNVFEIAGLGSTTNADGFQHATVTAGKDALRYVRAVITATSTPDADLTVELTLSHD